MGRYIKILVMVNLDKPLFRGTTIKCQGKAVWVDFKYEKVAAFCYFCGRIGHLERQCQQKLSETSSGSESNGQFGEWLRAGPIGKMTPQSSAPRARQESVRPPSTDRNMVTLPLRRADESPKPAIWEPGVLPEATLTNPVEHPATKEDQEGGTISRTGEDGKQRSQFTTEVCSEAQNKSLDISGNNQHGTDTGALPAAISPPRLAAELSNSLVSVPIREVAEQKVLHAVGQRGEGAPKPVKGRKGSKRWTRLVGKENVPALQESKMDEGSSVGMKRTWCLTDEPDEAESDAGQIYGKRIKVTQCETTAQVVEASLNWPQLNK